MATFSAHTASPPQSTGIVLLIFEIIGCSCALSSGDASAVDRLDPGHHLVAVHPLGETAPRGLEISKVTWISSWRPLAPGTGRGRPRLRFPCPSSQSRPIRGPAQSSLIARFPAS